MNARVPLAAAVTIAALALLAGCKGDTGPQGPPGPPGSGGDGGTNVTAIHVPPNSQAPTDASSTAWAALQPQVTVQSVTISSPPVVNFTVKDAAGSPIVGLGNTSQSATATLPGYTNLAFGMAKLVPGDTSDTNNVPSKWVSYMVTTVPSTTTAAAPSRPSTDNTGTLLDNGDGTYVYTFYRDVKQIQAQVAAMTVSPPNDTTDLGDLTYDPTLVHRLTIQLSGSAPGTGTNTPDGVQTVPGVTMTHPVDAIYDFTPSTGQPATSSGRDIVATSNCDGCHRQLGGIPGDNPESSAAGFHGGSRNDARYCVVCHTDQRKYGRTNSSFDANLAFTSSSTYRVYDRAIGNFPNQIHHIHAGPVLALKGYNYAGVLFNEVLYPQDLRNCTKCHDSTNPATPQADNWKNAPSRLACGGCHDGIDFATGMGVTLADAAKGLTQTTTFGGFAHGGSQQPDDTLCKQCHSSLRVDIDTAHLPVTPPSGDNSLLPAGTNGNTNAAWIASNPARLPAGAIAVSYDIKSVSLNPSGNPVMVFRLLQNGQPKPFNVFASATPNPASGAKELWDNFMGSPSAYFVFSVAQDRIAAPADYNAVASGYLRGIWNGAANNPDGSPKGAGSGTLEGPDGNGYYTVTLTGATIPTTGTNKAVMLTGGLGYSYSLSSTLPLTQTAAADGTPFTNYPVWNAGTATTTTPCVTAATAASPKCNGGLIVVAPNAQKVADGFTGRRPIVEDARCNACHQELGAFTEDAFHAGQRNDGTTCSWCHTPNKTSSGWSADSTYFVHAIHAGAKRQVPFTWHASSLTDSFADISYPGVLRDCQTCHVPGSYDFSADASATALPNKQYRTMAAGALNGNYDFSTNVGQPILAPGAAPACALALSGPATAVGAFSLSPPSYAPSTSPNSATPNYGIAFSFNPALTAIPANPQCTPDGNVSYTISGGQSTADVPAANASYQKNLVSSPVAGVCIACHDTDADRAHFELNGGSIWRERSTALNTIETCMICHGSGKIADIAVVHAP